ncbi:MAG: hypothetical protein DMG21_05405 [Acidobacteria bacterium]|nr:MAG: hypothetical protein DMG21_05405 [Acidobacteriota bacterium]
MRKKANHEDRGVTLIETMMAVLIAVFGVFTLGQVLFLSIVNNKNQGGEVTRATIFAQDKMEKLLSPNYATCTQSPATLQPSSGSTSCNTTNINAANWTQGLLAGGQVNPVVASCPTSGSSVGYIDFLDANGLQAPSGGATSCSALTNVPVSYIRMWKVTTLASTGGPELLQITVSVYAQSAVSAPGGTPIVQLTSSISNPN